MPARSGHNRCMALRSKINDFLLLGDVKSADRNVVGNINAKD
jgi:hypothetical protein